MIERRNLASRVERALKRSPVVALIGPRQCGKTTLARRFASNHASVSYFDLESPKDIARLASAELTLASVKGLIIIDEVQRMPDLFPLVRVLADRRPIRARFLLLGSVSPGLAKGVSETLAGRIEFIEMSGIEVTDRGAPPLEKLWLRGGLPRSCLAKTEMDSFAWRDNYVRTFLERDIPQLGISIPAVTLRRFWTMLAHYHGQTWNSSQIASSLGQSDKTIRSYLDILTGSFLIRQLPSWHENIGKRQVKAPKIYFRDSGLFHFLMDIPDARALEHNPRLGASWEGFALELALCSLKPMSSYFWATHSGAELDLMITDRGKRYGFEFKYADAPYITKSLASAIETLNLAKAWIVYPGDRAYALSKIVTAIPLSQIATKTSLSGLD